MNKKYIIQWKSKVNGRVGKGTKHFDREEAVQLANELNQQYPDIEHEIMVASQAEDRGTQPIELSAENQSDHKSDQSPSELSPVLSFQE